MRTFCFTSIFRFVLGFVLLLLSVSCQKGITRNFAEPPNVRIRSETPIDYLTVYYFSLISCMKCHVDRQGPELSTYESLVSSISQVQKVVTSGEMPPSGDGYSALSACQKLVLNTWVSRGMPVRGGISLGAAGNACY